MSGKRFGGAKRREQRGNSPGAEVGCMQAQHSKFAVGALHEGYADDHIDRSAHFDAYSKGHLRAICVHEPLVALRRISSSRGGKRPYIAHP